MPQGASCKATKLRVQGKKAARCRLQSRSWSWLTRRHDHLSVALALLFVCRPISVTLVLHSYSSAADLYVLSIIFPRISYLAPNIGPYRQTNCYLFPYLSFVNLSFAFSSSLFFRSSLSLCYSFNASTRVLPWLRHQLPRGINKTHLFDGFR